MRNMYKESRKRIIDWISMQLTGCTELYHGVDIKSEDENCSIKGINPIDRFPCGAIYPIFEGVGEDPAATNELSEVDDGKENEDGKEAEPIRRFVPPSSIGLSFYVKGSDVSIETTFSAVNYENEDNNGHSWHREGPHEAAVEYHPPSSPFDRNRVLLWEDQALADVLWRKHGDDWIVTVSLCNKNEMGDSFSSGLEFAMERAEKTLFEAKIELKIAKGEIGDYPRVDQSLLDDEEQEIELQYRNRKVYAVGHGTGVDWNVEENGDVIRLCTTAIPTAEVPHATADINSVQILNLHRLSEASKNKDETIEELSSFVEEYSNWIEKQESDVDSFSEPDKSIGLRIANRMRKAESRMKDGIALLNTDVQALLAFSLANQAIMDQMAQADKQNKKKSLEDQYKWRPFQLAFLLTVLESASNSDSELRDIVDLIWFPTGGGKTEAYFGLIAFMIFLRRLRHPDTGGGTVALMRYTLRLLTKDQYLRAARLICALELIRRGRNDLGDAHISIGMWVGGEASPNNYHDAADKVRKAQEAGKEPSLVIDKCPWCGQEFHVASGNYDARDNHFSFVCKNTMCDFGCDDGLIPCNVVDDYLYANPPTLLICTVDKFARMPWVADVGNFFGRLGNLPPELIIQDELHLIAGALGSINGIYEAALDTIIRLRGVYPKYIASTATIRSAANQIRKLYGREAAVFPPPGIDCDNSYFAKAVPVSEKPGRLYVGYYAPMLNRRECLAPLAAALLAAPAVLFSADKDNDLLMDAWWTGIIYHGSLKGLANSHMSFDSDVRDRLRRIIKEIKQRKSSETETDKIAALLEKRVLSAIEELTSHKSAAENAETFSRLAIKYPETGYLDVALATNMVSVGLDVARLALMVVNGQPLTTAEYIQASSRVGRSEVPGIVIANYYRDQTRSLSHYEQFRAYHEAFYRYVEPTSVTPFTWQARERALHAALVSVVRHGVAKIFEASEFSSESLDVQKSIEEFKKRCAEADVTLSQKINTHIDKLVNRWESEAMHFKEAKRGFKYYAGSDRAYESLLYNYDDKIQGTWSTLQSMRNVENTAMLKELLPKEL